MLGLFPKSEYEERQFALRPGDCLLLTTDGVTEAVDEHDEEFGNERLAALLRDARGRYVAKPDDRLYRRMVHLIVDTFGSRADLLAFLATKLSLRS